MLVLNSDRVILDEDWDILALYYLIYFSLKRTTGSYISIIVLSWWRVVVQLESNYSFRCYYLLVLGKIYTIHCWFIYYYHYYYFNYYYYLLIVILIILLFHNIIIIFSCIYVRFRKFSFCNEVGTLLKYSYLYNYLLKLLLLLLYSRTFVYVIRNFILKIGLKHS